MNSLSEKYVLRNRICVLAREIHKKVPNLSYNQILSALKLSLGFRSNTGLKDISGCLFLFEVDLIQAKEFRRTFHHEVNKFWTISEQHTGDLIAECSGFKSFSQLLLFHQINENLASGNWTLNSKRIGKPCNYLRFVTKCRSGLLDLVDVQIKVKEFSNLYTTAYFDAAGVAYPLPSPRFCNLSESYEGIVKSSIARAIAYNGLENWNAQLRFQRARHKLNVA